MVKVSPVSAKYIIHAKIDVEGVVEKPDVVGAVFGQTEGLLGPELELRELQRTGRIGRIEVNIKSKDGKSIGEILIPSNLNKSETSIIAAALETIDRVGPCSAEVSIQSIEDVRIDKRKYVVDRAREILKTMVKELPETKEISREVLEAVMTKEITEYQGLPSGPNIESSDEIIVVEGRADVLNLLRRGIMNVIAIEGTSIPKAIVELGKTKSLTAFIDGDRGGELILRELEQVTDVDYVAKAPRGKEVEDLTSKEIFKALNNKIKVERKKEEKRPEISQFKTMLESLVGTRGAYILANDLSILAKVPVRELFSTLRGVNAYAIVFDGIVTQKLVDIARKKNIRFIVGMKSAVRRRPSFVSILTLKNLESR